MKNKINWEFSHNVEGTPIWVGKTEKGAKLTAEKIDHEFKNITLVSAPEVPHTPTEEELKVISAREFLKEIPKDKLLVMYDKHVTVEEYLSESTYGFQVLSEKQGRLYGWTIVAIVNNGTLDFYASVCSKHDRFCKVIGIKEALKNTPIFNMSISSSINFKELNTIFVGIAKTILVPKIVKKCKRRF
jgi:hypothetical protein